MNPLSARVSRLQRAAWRLRRESPVRCDLPFALVLMTDERVHGDLVSLIERLPRTPPILIVFRHYGLPEDCRLRLARSAYRAAKARGHFLVVAGGGVPADGTHNHRGGDLRSLSVHSLREAVAKAHLAADLALVSPVFPTASHPGARVLGPARAAALADRLPMPAFALGGIGETNAQRLVGSPFAGFAVLSAIRT